MSLITKIANYTGTRQVLTWPANWSAELTAHLWGGGGGGGGGDSGATGGNGTGGSYAKKVFTVNGGDVIEITVGGAGGGGNGSQRGAAGGSAGGSLINRIWSTLDGLGAGLTTVYEPAWVAFLNQFGIWNTDIYSASFDQTYTINFPVSGTYTITGSCDNYGRVYIDGREVLYIGWYTQTYTTTINVTAGNHTVRVVGTNTGGPSGIAVTIDSPLVSYSGGRGGYAGYRGSSGGGGGSGGATVLRVNGIVLAVAGGGAGGAGAGVHGGDGTAPGPNLNDTSTAGQNGGDHPADGGGGGAGGGGSSGGNAGFWGGGSGQDPYDWSDTTGQGGTSGTSAGTETQLPNGINPGGLTNPYYPGSVAYGGTGTNYGSGGNAGQNGYALFELQSNKCYIKDSGSWTEVDTVWIKDSGIWQPVQQIWVKHNNLWQPTFHTTAPDFANSTGLFGVMARSGPQYQPPPADYGVDNSVGGFF